MYFKYSDKCGTVIDDNDSDNSAMSLGNSDVEVIVNQFLFRRHDH